MQGEVVAGGLPCSAVLERLSAWLAGELDPDETEAVRGHVELCSRCERFGGAFARAVQGLRVLREDPDPP